MPASPSARRRAAFRPRPGQRRRVKGLVAWFSGLALIVGGFGTGTLALWRTGALTGSNEVGLGETGAVLSVNGTDQPLTAWGAALGLTLGADEARAVVADPEGGLALPFQLALRADGHTGIDYSINVPEAKNPLSVFAAAGVEVFPVDHKRDCVPGVSPPSGVNLSGITGIDAKYGVKKTADLWWCATAVLDESKLGRYVNTAQVEAVDSSGSAMSAHDQWEAAIVPDPELDGSQSGQYENTVRVKASDPKGTEVSADDKWRTTVLADPDAGQNFAITVTPETTRPGATGAAP